MAEIKLAAEAREEFGKGAARRVRRAKRVPAVLYGHGSDPLHISLPGHDTLLALRQANVLLNIELPGGKSELALPKQVQRDFIKDGIVHVDLLIVKRGQKVQVEVPLVLFGQAMDETTVNQNLNSVSLLAEATNIPAEIRVSIEGADVGTQITLADLELPEDVTLAEGSDGLVLSVVKARAIEIETEVAEGEEGEEGAEGEAAESTAEAAEAAPAE